MFSQVPLSCDQVPPLEAVIRSFLYSETALGCTDMQKLACECTHTHTLIVSQCSDNSLDSPNCNNYPFRNFLQLTAGLLVNEPHTASETSLLGPCVRMCVGTCAGVCVYVEGASLSEQHVLCCCCVCLSVPLFALCCDHLTCAAVWPADRQVVDFGSSLPSRVL